jgi:catalase
MVSIVPPRGIVEQRPFVPNQLRRDGPDFYALQFLKSAGWSALLNNQANVRGRPLDISQGLPRKPKAHSFRFRIDGPSAGMATATEQSTTSASRALFLLFDEAQRARLFANIAAAMQGVRANITDRQIDLFRQVHPEFGAGVCEALGPQF